MAADDLVMQWAIAMTLLSHDIPVPASQGLLLVVAVIIVIIIYKESFQQKMPCYQMLGISGQCN